LTPSRATVKHILGRSAIALTIVLLVLSAAYVLYVRVNFGVWSPLAAPDRVDSDNGWRYSLEPDEDPQEEMHSLGVRGIQDLVRVMPAPIPTEFYMPRDDPWSWRLFSRTPDGLWHVMDVHGDPGHP
jgi:hypothetical protein